jgi:hypothetical protein
VCKANVGNNYFIIPKRPGGNGNIPQDPACGKNQFSFRVL